MTLPSLRVVLFKRMNVAFLKCTTPTFSKERHMALRKVAEHKVQYVQVWCVDLGTVHVYVIACQKVISNVSVWVFFLMCDLLYS